MPLCFQKQRQRNDTSGIIGVSWVKKLRNGGLELMLMVL